MQRAQRLSHIPPDLDEQIAQVKAQARAEGRDVIDLASSDLDWPAPPCGEDAAAPADFREAAARRLERRFGISVDPAHEITHVSTRKAGLACCTWAVVNPGDIVLMPDLAAPWVKANVLLAGGTPYDLPLRAENGWLPTLTAIPGEAVRAAKLLVLNYPHDPTGAVATRAFFQAAVNFAQETGILILNDASDAWLVSAGDRAPGILESEGALDVALEMYSWSERGGAGHGFLAGSSEAILAVKRIQSVIGGAAPTTAACGAASREENDDALAKMISVLTRRRDVLVDGLNNIGWQVAKPEASLFVRLPVPPGQTSAAFAQALLEEADVLTLPGVAFGPSGDGFVRLALTENEERIAEAVRRIGQHFSPTGRPGA